MYQLSDKNLDRLSREASEHVDPELNNAGWENLERLLDKELPQNKKDRRRFFLFLLFIALISGVGLTATIINGREDKLTQKIATPENSGVASADNSSEKITGDNAKNAESSPENSIHHNANVSTSSTPAEVQDNTHSSNAAVKQPVAAAKSGGDQAITPADNAQPQTGQPKKQHSLEPNAAPSTILADRKIKSSSGNDHSSAIKIKEKAFVTAAPVQDNKQRKVYGSKRHLTDRPEANPSISGSESLRQGKPSGNKRLQPDALTQNDKPGSEALTLNDQRLTAEQNRPAPAVIPVANNKTAATDSSLHQTSVAPADSANKMDSSATTAKLKKKNKRSSYFDIGIAAGPDLSTVKYHYTDNSGFNAGLRIGYHLNNRWSLHSGIIYTQKNYSAKGKDFHPPKDYWPNNYYLHKVEGSCFMLDIPLNIRYTITSSQKNKFFVSSGLSTYLMSKETYQYYYTLNGMMMNKDWTNNKNSHFIFSILNVSAGFEKAINKRFSVEAEPYAKLPLKGLGFGKMQMSSYGIYFSLIYKPSKK